jgi:hypothetical protein
MTTYVTSSMGFTCGGLGNHLFKLAATISYAKKYNKIPIFVNMHNNCYINGTMLMLEKSYTEFFSNKLNLISLNELQNIRFINIGENDARTYVEFPNINDRNVFIDGYLQSYKYISDDTRNEMNDLINSNSNYVNIAKSLFNIIKDHFKDYDEDNYLFTHLRRGDVANNNTALVDFDYLNNAYNKMKTIKNKSEMNVIVFSDDINWCYENVKCFPNVYFMDNVSNQYIELILMSMINNVIINRYGYHGSTTNFHRSTFCWWGTYLGNKNKTVIIPEKKTKEDFTIDYYLPEWIEI